MNPVVDLQRVGIGKGVVMDSRLSRFVSRFNELILGRHKEFPRHVGHESGLENPYYGFASCGDSSGTLRDLHTSAKRFREVVRFSVL